MIKKISYIYRRQIWLIQIMLPAKILLKIKFYIIDTSNFCMVEGNDVFDENVKVLAEASIEGPEEDSSSENSKEMFVSFSSTVDDSPEVKKDFE